MKHKLQFVRISKDHQFAGVGFAGNIFIILNALAHISDSDEMYVDMETNECACTEKDKILFSTKNCWEYYFDQTSNENIEKTFDSLLGARINYEDRDAFLFPKNFIEIRNKFWKNFKLKPHLNELINNFYNENIQGKITLGVQVRLTDMKHHHNVAPVEVYIEKIKEVLSQRPEIEQIFLSTDDSTAIEKIQKSIDLPLIYYVDMFRADSSKPHINPYDRFYFDRENHRYLIGLECCQEIFTLSKCDYLIKADVSSISIIASILSKNLKQIYKI